mgnify:CR=1 FL=1
MTHKTSYWDSVTQSSQDRDCTPEEIAQIQADEAAHAAASVNAPTLSTIAALEASVTPRRSREAVTTDAGKAWLVDVDKQIADLRTKLVK